MYYYCCISFSLQISPRKNLRKLKRRHYLQLLTEHQYKKERKIVLPQWDWPTPLILEERAIYGPCQPRNFSCWDLGKNVVLPPFCNILPQEVRFPSPIWLSKRALKLGSASWPGILIGALWAGHWCGDIEGTISALLKS